MGSGVPLRDEFDAGGVPVVSGSIAHDRRAKILAGELGDQRHQELVDRVDRLGILDGARGTLPAASARAPSSRKSGGQ